MRQTLADHGEQLRAWLGHPPQTNEVGRAAALLGGLRHVAAEAQLPIRLIEVGASAGLNLRADHFRVTGTGSYGDERSKVLLAALASEAIIDKALRTVMPHYHPKRPFTKTRRG